MLRSVHKTAAVAVTARDTTSVSATMTTCVDTGLESTAAPVRTAGVRQTALDDSVSRAAVTAVEAVSQVKDGVVARLVTMGAPVPTRSVAEDVETASALMSILVNATLDSRAQTVRSVLQDSMDPTANWCVLIAEYEGPVTMGRQAMVSVPAI